MCVCVYCYENYCFFTEEVWLFSLQSACPEECLPITQSLVLAPSLERSTWQGGAMQVHVDIMIQALTHMFRGEPYR